jgi:Flp pilus assembly protein TadD
MRLTSLRLTLLAGAALIAAPVCAQDAPAIQIDPAPSDLRDAAPPERAPLSAPAIIIEPGEPSPADAVPSAVPAEAEVAETDPAAPPIPAVWSPAPRDAQGRSAYGLYLSGRLAGMRGDRAASADFLASSHALTPEQPTVADEAFRAALFSGDIARVARLTPEVGDTPMLADAGRLFTIADALRRRDGRAALAELDRQAFSRPYDRAAGYLTPAVAAAAGAWDRATAPVQAAAQDPSGLVLRAQRAQALEMRRRYPEAETEYQALLAMPQGRRLYGVHYAAFLERRNRKDEALAAYAASLNGPSPDPRALAALQRMNGRGRPPPLPTPAQAAADALSFSALEVGENGLPELAVIYLQLASALHPDDATTLRLAASLARAEQNQLAREAFARVSQANPIQYAAAQVGLADALIADTQSEAALDALRRADAAAPGQSEVARRLAAGLIDAERYDEALAVLNRPDLDAGQTPEFQFLRGYALNQAGRLDEAEVELRAALQAAPDNPLLLNQLGYMLVDSARKVDEGAAMLARAHAADPENGNIQDSLGWAQYRQGQYDLAVTTLEQAVDKEPANAEIVDHLGDAYWRVGRTREAAWQWSRVLTLDAEPERRASVEAKIASGLPDPGTTARAATPPVGEP